MRYVSLSVLALALSVSALSVQAQETSQNNVQGTKVSAPADNSAVAQSQDNTIVFGEAENANGQQDEFLMEQSNSNENPLGNHLRGLYIYLYHQE